ncbi:hypothetical protein [Chitinophaga filiformis]|uniref:ATP-grasp domain-containing protein n=1 Tax=Chitinophaga filiformis TaxID=104663 RepID=A0ABY4HYU8_CHIFI|nr:hypothetical protein [Chitinophaga filiformis]UPK68304.1 hypothetical protein MYF79_25435 [Chitinophaga filiformis]
MILIVTHKSDFTVDYVIRKLNDKSIPYYRFNCEDVLKRSFGVQIDQQFKYHINGISDFSSVWFRRTKLPDFNQQPDGIKRYLQDEVDSLFSNLFNTIPAKWLSNPTNIYRAENKLVQLKEASKLGMNIPETIVTNQKDEIKKFYYENEKNIIIKPIYSNRIFLDNKFGLIYTNKLGEKHINDLDDFLLSPNIIQRLIDKQYELRVTIVDKSVFAAAVDSQSQKETEIDWRKSRLKFTAYKLPEYIEKQCIELVNSLGISFGAIDMIRSKDGSYYFLEVNPNGQWAWIENDTGLNISDAIIKYLNNK